MPLGEVRGANTSVWESAWEVAGAAIERPDRACLRLPRHLRRPLTWDGGREMTNHLAVAKAADLDIDFCDPHPLGNAAATKTPTDTCASAFPKAPTYRCGARATSTKSPPNSTADPANHSTGKRKPEHSTNHSQTHPLLHRPREPAHDFSYWDPDSVSRSGSTPQDGSAASHGTTPDTQWLSSATLSLRCRWRGGVA